MEKIIETITSLERGTDNDRCARACMENIAAWGVIGIGNYDRELCIICYDMSSATWIVGMWSNEADHPVALQ